MASRKRNSQLYRTKGNDAEFCAISDCGEERVKWSNDDGTPSGLKDMFEEARDNAEKSLFLQEGLTLKIAFANYGFELRPDATVGKLTKTAKKSLAQWRKEKARHIAQFVKDTWWDRFALDNSISFWRTKPGTEEVQQVKDSTPVFTLKPERCEYTNAFGNERMRIDRREVTRESLKGMGFTDKQIERYTGNPWLEKALGENFKVLTRARPGDGLCKPRLEAIVRTHRQEVSMEVADQAWAFLSRAAIRQFKIGHEIKQGLKAGSNVWFWNKAKGEAIKKFFDGRVGAIDWSTNFDFNVEFPFPTLERFGHQKYESVMQRMAMWLGPIGLLFLGRATSKDIVEIWLKFARAEMAQEREDVGLYLRDVINEVFAPPVELMPFWSDQIFVDSRQALEMAKNLLAAGPLSQTTALLMAGHNPEEERENKTMEADLPKEQTLPIFDPSHGKRPGEPAGRPSGQKE